MASPLIDFVAGFGVWNWFFLAIILLAMETVLPGVHFLWFGLAAAVVGLLVVAANAAGYVDLVTWPMQLVAYALISVAAVFWVRTYARPDKSKSDEPALNVRGAQYIGRVVKVENEILGGRGKVRIGDTLWPAQGADAPAGSNVRVTGANDTVLVVERVAG